jgi:hypothetical protein
VGIRARTGGSKEIFGKNHINSRGEAKSGIFHRQRPQLPLALSAQRSYASFRSANSRMALPQVNEHGRLIAAAAKAALTPARVPAQGRPLPAIRVTGWHARPIGIKAGFECQLADSGELPAAAARGPFTFAERRRDIRLGKSWASPPHCRNELRVDTAWPPPTHKTRHFFFPSAFTTWATTEDTSSPAPASFSRVLPLT